jgi:hypothetical protein
MAGFVIARPKAAAISKYLGGRLALPLAAGVIVFRLAVAGTATPVSPDISYAGVRLAHNLH